MICSPNEWRIPRKKICSPRVPTAIGSPYLQCHCISAPCEVCRLQNIARDIGHHHRQRFKLCEGFSVSHASSFLSFTVYCQIGHPQTLNHNCNYVLYRQSVRCTFNDIFCGLWSLERQTNLLKTVFLQMASQRCLTDVQAVPQLMRSTCLDTRDMVHTS